MIREGVFLPSIWQSGVHRKRLRIVETAECPCTNSRQMTARRANIRLADESTSGGPHEKGSDKEVADRRENLADQSIPAGSGSKWGLALSGGGIRRFSKRIKTC